MSVIAALSAIPSALFGRGRARLGGAIASALAVTLAVAGYPAMQIDQARYAEMVRGKKPAASIPAPGITWKAADK